MTPTVNTIRRHSLRWRIMLSYPLLGLLLGLALILFLYASLEWMERGIMDGYIREEMQHFIEAVNKDASLQHSSTSRWQASVSPSGQAPKALPFTSQFRPGIHEAALDGMEFDIFIQEQNGKRYTLILNDTDFELREQQLLQVLAAMFLLSLLLASWLGWFMSRRVVRPIEELTDYVQRQSSADNCDDTPDPGALLEAQDETGELARHFHAHQKRLCRFLERERSFTGDASHELRTPLAVIRATTEGLLLRTRDDTNLLQRLQRLDHTAEEMEKTLTMLLMLARETSAGGNEGLDEQNAVGEVVTDLIEREIHLRGLSPDLLQLDAQSNPTLPASKESIVLVVGNLLRNAIEHGLMNNEPCPVTVILDARCLSIRDQGPGIPDSVLPRITEHGRRLQGGENDRTLHGGLGLAIAERVCEYHGWRLALHNQPDGGLHVLWCFN